MLIARGHTHLGEADLRWALTFAPRLWAVAVERTGLVMDTRFVPASPDPPRPRACVYFLVRGAWTVHEPAVARVDAPSAFVVSEVQLDGAAGSRPFTYSAIGHPYSAVELHLQAEDLAVAPSTIPVPLAVDERTWEAARNAVRVTDHDDDAFRRALAALLERLATQAVVRPGVVERARQGTSKTFALLWTAFRPMIERLYLSPTLQEVGDLTGVSARQIDRHIRTFAASFGLAGTRWRPATRHLRLKLAVILLSADGASVAEVATAVGYGSSDAMARAFRDAGLLAPGVVQQQMRAARDGWQKVSAAPDGPAA